MPSSARTTLVFGAAGLIGQYLSADLRRRGFRAVGIARRFPAHAQPDEIALPVISLTAQELAELIQANRADVVVNCLGVLQDGPGSDTRDVHVAFVERLVDAIMRAGRDNRLVHLSMPGRDVDDHTPFSRTKRDAGRAAHAGQPMSDGRRGAWPDDGVILYDGICIFCSRWVRFVAARDVAEKFRFTAIQSAYGRRLAETFGIDPASPDTNAVIFDGQALFKSDAALAVIASLPHWRWARVLRLVPKPLRDAVYDLVARSRYRIFGTYPTCYLGDASFRSWMME